MATSWKAEIDGAVKALDSTKQTIWHESYGTNIWTEAEPDGTIKTISKDFTIRHIVYKDPISCNATFELKKSGHQGHLEPRGRFVSAQCKVPEAVKITVDCNRNFNSDEKRLSINLTLRPKAEN